MVSRKPKIPFGLAALQDLHPAAKPYFEPLIDQLEVSKTMNRLLPFEGWRAPYRQRELLLQRPPVTKAPPWQSIHQYGFCLDFALKQDDDWSWNIGEPLQRELHRLAEPLGLHAPISWDPLHIQVKNWKTILCKWLVENIT